MSNGWIRLSLVATAFLVFGGCVADAPASSSSPATSAMSPSSSSDGDMCKDPSMASMCPPTNASAPRTLPTKTVVFAQPGTMMGGGTATLQIDAAARSLAIRLFVNATTASQPYAIVGPGQPPQDPVFRFAPASGTNKDIPLTGMNGKNGASAMGPIGTFTADIPTGVAASYTLSLTGSGQNAQVSAVVTEYFR